VKDDRHDERAEEDERICVEMHRSVLL
jgi:hypothetical protein